MGFPPPPLQASAGIVFDAPNVGGSLDIAALTTLDLDANGPLEIDSLDKIDITAPDTNPGGGVVVTSGVGGHGGRLELGRTVPGVFLRSFNNEEVLIIGGNGGTPRIQVKPAAPNPRIVLDMGFVEVNVQSNKVGFLGVPPVVQQATPVVLADVIALLQAFGFAA